MTLPEGWLWIAISPEVWVLMCKWGDINKSPNDCLKELISHSSAKSEQEIRKKVVDELEIHLAEVNNPFPEEGYGGGYWYEIKRSVDKGGVAMTYNVTEYYGEKPQELLKREFSLESLERDIKYAEEDIHHIQKYLEVAKGQLALAMETSLKYYVEFRKEHNYSTKHINYIILVYQLPDIPDANKNARSMYLYTPQSDPGSHNKPFLGNEKKAAIEYARSLSKKYGNCEIVGNAAELVKPEKGVILI